MRTVTWVIAIIAFLICFSSGFVAGMVISAFFIGIGVGIWSALNG